MNKMLWPGLLIFLVVMTVVAHAALFFYAANDPSFSVDASYGSQHAIDLPATWTADLALRSLGEADGAAMIELRVVDVDESPVAGATATVQAFHKASAATVVQTELVEIEPGRYAGALPMERPGFWKVRAVVRRGDEVLRCGFDRRVGASS